MILPSPYTINYRTEQSVRRTFSCHSLRVCCVSSGVKTQVTVLCCTSAAGSSIPPLVIFQRANLLKCLTLGEVPGTIYGLNPESGWINGEILKEWFVRHFLVYAPAGRPLLLLLDGHKAHYNRILFEKLPNME